MQISGIYIKNRHITSFLKVTGDSNDIHFKKYAAKNKGFSDVVAPGMFTGPSVLYNVLADPELPDISLFRNFKFKWMHPVYRKDTLHTDVSQKQDCIDLKITNQNGIEVMNISCREKPKEVYVPQNAGKEYVKEITLKDIYNFLRITGPPQQKSIQNIIFSMLPSGVLARAGYFKQETMPDLLISALVPPSLLIWSGGNGLHMMQEINIHNPALPNQKIRAETYFEKGKKTEKGMVYAGSYVCKSDETVLQSGRVMCFTENELGIENFINKTKSSDC